MAYNRKRCKSEDGIVFGFGILPESVGIPDNLLVSADETVRE
jgi:hypothetical protein